MRRTVLLMAADLTLNVAVLAAGFALISLCWLIEKREAQR